MRKFIHSSFEIDLSKLKISDVQENPWFTDKFFSKFTFPFEMDLSEENDINFGFISFYNANSHTTLFKGKYVHRNIMEDAVLEIEEVSDKITLSLSYGFDEFPNFKKKLSELPLDKFEVTNIYDHAATIIPQTWPAVNYNFPQLHIDKIDNTQAPWEAFEGIINNYKDGAFLINEVDVDDITYNRNIIQPLPYALHILQKGFEDAGKTLTGDVLTDDRIKKMCIYSDAEYWTTFEQESYTILQMSEDKVETESFTVQGSFPGTFSWSDPIVNPTVTRWRYFQQIDITSPGKYRIIGKVKMINPRYTRSHLIIKYRNQIIHERSWFPFWSSSPFGIPRDVNVNVVFETLADLDPNFITVELFNGTSSNKVIFDLGINPIRLHDSSGSAIPTIVNLNQVDLTRAVPKITFGEFVTAFKNWFNLDITPVGNEIRMNFIKTEIDNAEVFDLSMYEVANPPRKFTRGISFLLKFQDVKTDEYTFNPVYHSFEQIATSDFKTDEKTNEINVNALPLPLAVRNDIQTAHAFDTDETKIYAVIYDGLTSGLNLAKPSTELLMENIHESCWKKWFDYRIKSQNFSWSFLAYYENIIDLYYKGKVFAYGLHHIVKNLNRTEIAEDLFEIEIETEAEI